MRAIILFCVLLCIGQLAAQEHSVEYVRGLEAYKSGDVDKYLLLMKQAHQQNPEHDLISFEYLKALTCNGQVRKVRKQLSLLINRRSITVYGLDKDKFFEAVMTDRLSERIWEIEKPVLHSDTVAVITERDLILEGIAVDHLSGRKFIGSTHKEKIVVVEPDGSFADFSNPQDSLWGMLGMEADEERGILWAATAYLPSRPTSPNSGCSRLVKMDLENGRVLKDYKVCNDLINDLTVSPNGDVFATGSISAKLYKLDNHFDKFVPFIDFGAMGYRYLNGVSIDLKRQKLYVAHETGVLVVEERSGHFRELKKPSHISLIGIDGMAYYQNSLICHQKMLNSVTRYLLSGDGRSVIGEEIVDANHPAFDSPTTGELGGDGYYYYLANSQISSAYSADGKIKDYKDLQDKIILRWKLPELH